MRHVQLLVSQANVKPLIEPSPTPLKSNSEHPVCKRRLEEAAATVFTEAMRRISLRSRSERLASAGSCIVPSSTVKTTNSGPPEVVGGEVGAFVFLGDFVVLGFFFFFFFLRILDVLFPLSSCFKTLVFGISKRPMLS